MRSCIDEHFNVMFFNRAMDDFLESGEEHKENPHDRMHTGLIVKSLFFLSSADAKKLSDYFLKLSLQKAGIDEIREVEKKYESAFTTNDKPSPRKTPSIIIT